MARNPFISLILASSILLCLFGYTHISLLYTKLSQSSNSWSSLSMNLRAVPSPKSPCDDLELRDSVWLFETKFNWTTPRALCAAESLASVMPTWCVRMNVLNLQQQQNVQQTAAFELLRRKHNLRISRLYPETFLWGTPLQNFSSRQGRQSTNYIVDLSDALRTAALFKHGGIYVDLDMIALKPVDVAKNFFTRQVSGGMIGNAIIKSAEPSSPVLWRAMERVRKEFNPRQYGTQMTTFCWTVVEYCNTMGVPIDSTDRRDPLDQKCGDWHVLGASGNAMCHPYQMYEKDRNTVENLLRNLSEDNCTLLHWYSTYHGSNHRPINLKEEKDVFFTRIATEYCPIVANSVTIF